MTDPARNGPIERDIEQAITALKKGAYLLKYGRRGKPKFCPFRLSNDESVLIWYSGKEEKQLKLSQVSRIVPGQRTAVFQRYPRPEKEYQSFSLIYSDRSLDLICKDKDEAEVWFVGLKALISNGYQRRWRTDTKSDGAASSDTNSPNGHTRRNSPLNSAIGSTESAKESGDPHQSKISYGSPPLHGLEQTLADGMLYAMPSKGAFQSDSIGGSLHSASSEGGSENVFGHTRGGTMDTFRISLSSAVSSSSHGSGQDDGDALGDVFIWGEGSGDGILGGGMHKTKNSGDPKLDALLPKQMESAVVLDVQNIACGKRHAALVTKQGEVFSWGEESGGRLGHGADIDVSHPKLIEALTNTNIELVACGEYHSCAVTLSGDLYTWGDGTHNYGLLGHRNDVSHWVPKKVNGPLEGIHVSSVSCGPWHTAVVTSAGQLFTFGDGSFGALGHGDKVSAAYPREVESLKGLRTVRAACGVWHTAAVVEVMVGSTSLSNCSSGKLFTWGDGDKGKLGHGDKETRLVPTCVAALVEPNFRQVACGHSLTVALATSGHVYTMGSPVYGQLGCPSSDGKLPSRVEGKLQNSFVEDISCGAFHIAVLTSKTEVYTWGKGANGRLGHGDIEDRNIPTLVEALKDKQVKSVVCGTSFTAAICLHKWVSGADQSACSGCRLPFGFTRKRHNCYNCGLVFCHACSAKKSVRASLAPNPNKPYRVCDNCFTKIKKTLESSSPLKTLGIRHGTANQHSFDTVEKQERLDNRTQLELSLFFNAEVLKQIEGRSSSRRNRRLEFHSSRVSPIPNGSSQRVNAHNSRSVTPAYSSSKKVLSASVPGSRVVSRTSSPVSRRTSPPRSTTPIPTVSGLTSPKCCIDNSKRTNDALNQEIIKLRLQVENLSRKSRMQGIELGRSVRQLKEAIAIANEESAKCKAAKEVIKSLTSQLKDMAERLPGGYRYNKQGSLMPCTSNDTDQIGFNNRTVASDTETNRSQVGQHSNTLTAVNDGFDGKISHGVENIISDMTNGHSSLGNKGFMESAQLQLPDVSKKNQGNNIDRIPRLSSRSLSKNEHEEESEWVEQDEPGVYITLSSLPGGGKDLKRVRFSRKRFTEKQAEQWWQENRARIYEQYNIRILDKSNMGPSSLGGLETS